MHAYVRDIMTTGVVTVRPDTPYREIAAMFREHQVSGFPVTAKDGTVIGVVSESDLLALAAGRQHRGHRADDQATAGDLMTHPAVTIGPDDLVQTAARVMHSRRLQRLPVVDRDGRLEGIVSRSDVLSVFRRSDEEIRREITQDRDRGRVLHRSGAVHGDRAQRDRDAGGRAGQRRARQPVSPARLEHLEGVIAVRDRFVYPARSAPSFPSDPGL